MDRIASLREFLKTSPKDSFLKHALALEYIKLGDDATAKLLFEELLGDEPAYIGSYYHLGRLLEREGNTEGAIAVFEKGMAEAKKAGDRHAYGELQAAVDDLI